MSRLVLEAVATRPQGSVDLVLEAGRLALLIGPNGAGKSALLKTVIGLRRAVAGRILLDGRELGRLAPERRARLGLGWCPEGRRVFPGLTVAENFEVACPRPAEGRRALQDRVLALFPGLGAKLRVPAWQLSGGEQQMVAIGRALMTAPRVLLLDEPSLGLAPALVGELFRAARQIAAEGCSVLLAEQAVAPALGVADQVILLERGRMAAAGTPAMLRRHPALEAVFLGR